MDIDSVDFESTNLEQLKALPTNKPIKLEKLIIRHSIHILAALELYFTSGLESTAYKTTSFDQSDGEYEKTWDTEKQIKKVLIKMYGKRCYGIQFLDE